MKSKTNDFVDELKNNGPFQVTPNSLGDLVKKYEIG